MGGKYDEMIDRKSAEEMLQSKRDAAIKAQEKTQEKSEKETKKSSKKRKSSSRKRKSAGDHILYEAKLIGRQLVRSQGRKLLRGILGSVMRR